MMCGGASEAKAATEETQQIAQEMKAKVEEKEGRTFAIFKAIEYATQVVAGTNIFIKVHAGNDEYIHMRVFKCLPHENKPLTLVSHQSKKSKHDELAYF